MAAPGPIDAEMIRRGLLPKDRGGGFWSAWPIGLGACTGDFLWAFGVSVGAGTLLNSVEIRRVLAIVSLALLLFLAVRFAIGAWKIYRAHRSVEFQAPKSERRGGFLFGLFVVLMSPWNVGFWPNWQVATEAITAAVMLWFAIRPCSIFHEPDYRTTDRNPDDQRDLSLDSG